jgi:hypothetical protein
MRYMQILSQFVKPPSDALLRHFNMFHLAPSPSFLQFTITLSDYCNFLMVLLH